MPYSPAMDNPRAGASSTRAADWTTFDKALAYADVAGLDGVMRAFVHEDGQVGVDLDNCRDPETGALTPDAAERVKRADTYTEVSPSGTGVKLWMYATMPAFGHKRGDVEMYGSVEGQSGPCGRFFTMTGRRLEGTPATVGYRPDFVAALHREVFGDAPDFLSDSAENPDRPTPALQLGDDDVIRVASESTHNGERFRRLWSGDTGDYAVDGNEGASEADAALCELLAYYGGPDPERIDRLYRRSGLARDKWDRADYRTRTIDLAVRGKTRFYGDSIRATPAAIGTDGAETGVDGLRARVAYLERALIDRDDRIEGLLAANATLSTRLTARTAEVEQLNRRIYADARLAKVTTLTSSQKDTIRAIARVATGRAEHFDTDSPIITGETLAAEIGKHASTARAAAEAVCGLPGAPITRANAPGGKYGKVTTYELAVRDPAAIIERFVVIAENLTEKVSSRPQPPRCRDHPAAQVWDYTRKVCSVCRRTLASTFPGEDALCVQNARIAPDAPTVSVRTTSVQNARIAPEPAWLTDWPDPPDLAHTVRYYDDVPIAGGET
jgi:putative DNA primase/helicase